MKWKIDKNLIVADPLVVIFGIFVEPDFRQPDIVALEHIDATSPLVGRPFAEDVAHVTARNNLQSSTAHPSLQICNISFFYNPKDVFFNYFLP